MQDQNQTNVPAISDESRNLPEMPLGELYKLWDQLRDVPVSDDGLTLDAPFLHFEKGAEKEDVWNWFEAQNTRFVVGDVMQGIRITDDDRKVVPVSESNVVYLTNALGEATGNGPAFTEDDLNKVPFECGPGNVRAHLTAIDGRKYVQGDLEVYFADEYSTDVDADIKGKVLAYCEAVQDFLAQRLTSSALLLPLFDGDSGRITVSVAVPLDSVHSSPDALCQLNDLFGTAADLADVTNLADRPFKEGKLQQSSLAMAFEVTKDDVLAVLKRHAVRVNNSNGRSFSYMAEALFEDLDLDEVSVAALAGGNDLDEQTAAAHTEIAQQLVDQGVMKGEPRKVSESETHEVGLFSQSAVHKAPSSENFQGKLPMLRINVRQTATELDSPDDEGLEGVYDVTFHLDTAGLTTQKQASMALDIFHSNQGIDCLDDFDITVIDERGCAVDQDESHENFSAGKSGWVEKVSDDPIDPYAYTKADDKSPSFGM